MNTSEDMKMKMVDDSVGNQVRQNAVQNVGNKVGQNAVQNLGIQIVENMNWLSVVSESANQYGNRNVVIEPTKGNGNGINGIQSTQEEFKFMAVADAYEETKKVKVNCTSEDTLQQASTSGTQSDNAPVYDSDGSTEIERLQAQLGDLKGKSNDTQCASKTLDPLSQKLEDENVSLEFQVLNYAKENAHLKTTYKNLFDSIKVTQAQTKSIITANHDVCVLNYVNDMNSHADNQSVNVLIRENQKKHKAVAKKSKELGFKGSIASSRPSNLELVLGGFQLEEFLPCVEN
ncbi:hypothetical protein Tco_0688028 [Tanacetum coccineum]